MPFQILIAYIASRSQAKAASTERLTDHFAERANQLASVSTRAFAAEATLWTVLDKQHARTPVHLILLDPCGKLLSSELFAAHLGHQRDSGVQNVVLAVGPANGWTDTARARADLLLSLGPMTLPHELARVLLAEQVYRALTILAGHPYHSGH